MKNKLKKLAIYIQRVAHYCKRRVLSCISYSILFLSALICFIVVFASVAHRVPIISFAGEKISFPHKYVLGGKIELYDENTPVSVPVEISVGGFSVKTSTKHEFKLPFVSDNSDKIPLIICYKYNGTEYTKIEYLIYGSDYYLYQDFCFDVGD